MPIIVTNYVRFVLAETGCTNYIGTRVHQADHQTTQGQDLLQSSLGGVGGDG